MYKEFIDHNTWAILLLIFLIFSLLKWYGMFQYRVKGNRMLIFWASMKIYSWQEIRNNFNVSNSYLRFSNKVNKLFYPVFGVVIVIYVFVRMLE